MSQIDRSEGLVGNTAFKAPVRCATIADITLNGEQTVDGIACLTGDRVLVKDQDDATQNGIWVCDTGDWNRSADFDGSYDAADGSMVLVVEGGTNGTTIFRLATADPIVIGTTSLTFLPSGVADSANISFIAAGVGAVILSALAKMRQVVNVKDYGAAPGNSNADNKTALQTAITAVNLAGGGVIVVDYDICYGVDNEDATTWPDFNSPTVCTKPIIIQDSSRGATYAPNVYPVEYDGAQYREWYFTPQTTAALTFTGTVANGATSATLTGNWAKLSGPWIVTFSNGDVRYVTLTNGATTATWSTGLTSGATASATYQNSGNHDGNTTWFRGAWAPALISDNISNLAAASTATRTALDNRRAGFAMAVDGDATWQLLQGANVGSTYTDEELSDLVIQKFAATGDTLGAFSPWLCQRKTSRISYGGGNTVPAAAHHFSIASVAANATVAMFENPLSTTATLVLRNLTGVTKDLGVKNVAGDMVLNIEAQGDALTVLGTNRYVGVFIPTPTSPFHVARSLDSSYVTTINNLSATNGGGVRLISGTAAGTGFNFLNAESGGGGSNVYTLRGDGTGYADVTWTTPAADYAEYFEWADGNPKKEDRRGMSVAAAGDGKIRLAKDGDKIIGIVSGNPSVIGNNPMVAWAKKWLRDDFGTPLMEDYEIVSWTERVKTADAQPEIPDTEDIIYKSGKGGKLVKNVIHRPGCKASPEMFETTEHSYQADKIPDGVVVPDDAKREQAKRKVHNPAYDPDALYVSREYRQEWDTIGLLGRLPLRKGQPVAAAWIRLGDISQEVEEWLVK